jgi:hypothetical protein
MTSRKSAIATDLFTADLHQKKLVHLRDPLVRIATHIDVASLASEVDRVAPRPISPRGGRPSIRRRSWSASLISCVSTF